MRHTPAILLLSLLASSCNLSDEVRAPQAGEPCSREGALFEGLRCEQGRWLGEVPPDPSCMPETDAAFCARLGAQCGLLSGTDQCGQRRPAARCGDCPGGETCGADNRCPCTPAPDEALCASQAATCGALTVTDSCGQARQLSCGDCTASERCVGNQCVCEAPDDATLCAERALSCGAYPIVDQCGSERTITCGECLPDASCEAGLCQCPELLCPPQARCGALSNGCGASASCGVCEGVDTCVAFDCSVPVIEATPGEGMDEGALALSGDTLFVGVPGEAVGADASAGVVLVYGRDAELGWRQVQRLEAPTARANARFGSALAITRGVLFVGAPGDGAGRVYTARWDDAAQRWQPAGALAPLSRLGDGAAYGASLATWEEDIVVGAPGEAADTGEVHLFQCPDLELARCQSVAFTPPQAQALRRFGYRVAVSERHVAVADLTQTRLLGEGRVTLLRRANARSAWGALTTLVPPETSPFQPAIGPLGEGLAMVEGWLFVGAPGVTGQLLAQRRPVTYAIPMGQPALQSMSSALALETPDVVSQVIANPAADQSYFGASVVVQGGVAAIGMPRRPQQREAGSVAVYKLNSAQDAWARVLELIPEPGARGRFGAALAMEDETLIVASPRLSAGGGFSSYQLPD